LPSASLSLRHFLRASTDEAHSRLDAMLDNLDLFARQSAYRVFLSAMEALYLTYGDSLDWAAGQAGLAPRSDELIASLRRDIGMGATQPRIAGGVASPAARWGIGYVLEGSALGAQLLLRRARRELTPGSSTDYLGTLAAEAQSRWPRFALALDNSGADAEVAARSSHAVFADTLRLLEPGSNLDLAAHDG
jgi:heme oxygenase